MVSPLLLALRQATADRHHALEATPCMARLGADDLDSAGLARALQVLLAGFSAIEPALSAEDWYRPQAPALAEDVAHLAPPLRELDSAPLPLADGAARLGAAYVLIGSRLGAKTIARRLDARFGEGYAAGSAYYGREAVHAPAQWQALQQRLAEAPPGDHAAATAAAAAAFDRLIALSGQASRA